MNPISNLGLLATFILPATADAQARVATLARAQETFTDVDTNKDGKLSPEEVVAKLQLNASDVRGVDADKDGFWSKDEFLLFYRQRIVAANVKPSADLEAEATRILAARKAKAAERGTPRAGAEGRDPAKTDLAPTALADALDALQVKASAGQAKDADFDHLRELLVAEARASDRAAKGADAEAGEKSELQQKLLQSIERLRAAAASGTFTRDEYQALRQRFIERARGAAARTAATPAAGTDAELLAIEKGLDEALDRLEKRAAAGNPTREDFQRVRDQLIARARAAANGANAGAPNEPEAAALQAKLLQSIDRLEAAAQKGVISREEYTQLRDSMIHRAREIENPGQPRATVASTSSDDAGVRQAVDEVEKRVEGGQVSAADFKQLRELIAAKAQPAAGKSGPEAANEAAAYQKLMQALERLENAAKSGSVDRQEFKAFKDSFVHRARQIANDAQRSSSQQSNSSSSKSGGNDQDAANRRSGSPTATPTPVRIQPDKGAVKRADPARDAEKSKEDPKPAPQPAPASRPKPAPENERPQPAPPQQPPHRPAPESGGGGRP